MTSKERMLAALAYNEVDYTPCSFMLFANLYEKCQSEREYIEKQVELGIDAFVHVGHLNHTMHLYGILHPDVKPSKWVAYRRRFPPFKRLDRTTDGRGPGKAGRGS